MNTPVHTTQEPPPEIADAFGAAAERLGIFARHLTWFPEVTSTSDVAAALAERGAPEGSVVAANAQSAGRGRHGRQWVSPADTGVYLSAVLRPPPHAVRLLTIAAGLGVVEGIRAASGLTALIKWPNDVYVSGQKLAGILAEAGSSASGIQHVVLGIGINVAPGSYPEELAGRATSLEAELGRPVDRGLLIVECLAALDRRYGELQRGEPAAVLDAWRERAGATFGRSVQWEADGTRLRGTAENIDDSGALLVRTPHGVERIISGQVTWL